MEALYIPQLANRQDRTLEVIVDELVPEFVTLTPVRGKVIVKHGGTVSSTGTGCSPVNSAAT